MVSESSRIYLCIDLDSESGVEAFVLGLDAKNEPLLIG